jgi:hypothetical protein
VEDTEDVDHELVQRLVDLVGDERPFLVRRRPHARTYVVARPASVREQKDPVDVIEDRRRETASDVGGCVRRDPVIEIVELAFGFRSEVDPARH